MSALLSIRGLSIGYPSKGKRGRNLKENRVVVSDMDLDLEAGELVCLLGPNGAGKSTLLRTIAGLQPALAGKILLQGMESLTSDSLWPDKIWARNVAIVLTERFASGNLTVNALVALGRQPFTGWLGRLGHTDAEAIRHALVDAGAWELRDRNYSELSDGEMQRVMLARALAQEPRLLLLDEPTAFLDLPRRVETMRTLRRLAQERGRAVLLSTHDLDLAMRVADRLWLLPPGGPIQSGLPEDLALSGTIGKIFDQGDVAFDLTSGHFRVHGHPNRFALLSGHPTLVFWTGRALEREGYAVRNEQGAGSGLKSDSDTENKSEIHIEAKYQNGEPTWRLVSEPLRGNMNSLLELIKSLRSR